uniref:Uncharacterized protein n=1 Tax=Glossina austeni TaxID=7395 RepID=A0A1A9ULC9_GLOAU
MLVLKLWYNGPDNVTINMTTDGNAFVTVTTTGNYAKPLSSPAVAPFTVDTKLAFATFNEGLAAYQALPPVEQQA